MTGVESELVRLARRSEHPDRKRGRRIIPSPLRTAPLRGAMTNKTLRDFAAEHEPAAMSRWHEAYTACRLRELNGDEPNLTDAHDPYYIMVQAEADLVAALVPLLGSGRYTVEGHCNGAVERERLHPDTFNPLWCRLAMDDCGVNEIDEAGRTVNAWSNCVVIELGADTGELQPLHNLGAGWWTMPEACIWIATHDGQYIAGMDERSRRSMFVADQTLADRGVWEAHRLLVAAAGRGLVTITGRHRGQGSQDPIAAHAWANLELAEHHGDMIARAPGLDPWADWWDTLRVSADAIRAQWPAATPATVATPATLPPPTPPKPRKAGAGNVPFDDSALVARALKGLADNMYKSPRDAARAMVGEIAGGGTDESKMRRLAMKIRDARGE